VLKRGFPSLYTHQEITQIPYIVADRNEEGSIDMSSNRYKLKTMMGIVACALVAGGAAATTSLAQDKKEDRVAVSNEPGATTATYGNWVLQCVRTNGGAAGAAASEGKSCEVVQSIQVQGQPQPVAQIALGRLTKDSKLQVTVVLPVNITPSQTVRLSGNGKIGAEEKGSVELPWVRCIGGACLATAEPTPDFLATVRTAPEGKMRFVDANGQNVELPLSWTGISQALSALDKAS